MISLKTHNVMDYVHGATVAACPYVTGLNRIPAARNALLGFGLGTIGYSLVTDYDYSLAKFIPIGPHMALDVTAGIGVMTAPFIFGYAHKLNAWQMALHFGLGLGAIGLVLMTGSKTEKQAIVKGEHVRLTRQKGSGHITKKAAA